MKHHAFSNRTRLYRVGGGFANHFSQSCRAAHFFELAGRVCVTLRRRHSTTWGVSFQERGRRWSASEKVTRLFEMAADGEVVAEYADATNRRSGFLRDYRERFSSRILAAN